MLKKIKVKGAIKQYLNDTVIQRRLLKVSGVFLVLLVLGANLGIEWYASNKTYNSVAKIPKNNTALLLGTGKYLSNGNTNLFYTYRIRAAVQLFKAGKVNYILISGDNGSKVYDEPTTFKEDLMAAGIPESCIYLDYAGFRTLDSVVRAKAVFGQESITVISQEFHNERAIAIAGLKGIKAIGYNAKNVRGKNGFRVKVREVLARAKVVIDWIIMKQPKFLGEPIKIPKA